jgi:hypothetical protein
VILQSLEHCGFGQKVGKLKAMTYFVKDSKIGGVALMAVLPKGSRLANIMHTQTLHMAVQTAT